MLKVRIRIKCSFSQPATMGQPWVSAFPTAKRYRRFLQGVSLQAAKTAFDNAGRGRKMGWLDRLKLSKKKNLSPEVRAHINTSAGLSVQGNTGCLLSLSSW